ncbi:hypothetical protein [Corynebacterium gerontici]|nr:hypothetical protein [Corynebacterium gerontici]
MNRILINAALTRLASGHAPLIVEAPNVTAGYPPTPPEHRKQ